MDKTRTCSYIPLPRAQETKHRRVRMAREGRPPEGIVKLLETSQICDILLRLGQIDLGTGGGLADLALAVEREEAGPHLPERFLLLRGYVAQMAAWDFVGDGLGHGGLVKWYGLRCE